MYAAILAFIIPTITIICFYVAIAIRLRTYHIKNKKTNKSDVIEKHEDNEVLQAHYSSLPSPKCEVCGDFVKVTEDIFVEIEKTEAEEAEDTEAFKFSKFCNSCNKKEDPGVATQELTRNNSSYR